jgi:exosortase
MHSNPAWNRSVLLLALATAVYFQTWSDLWPYWEHKNATYTHGTLIALISIYLVWRARPALAGMTPAPSTVALPLVLLLSLAWTVAARGNVLVAHAMLWPALAFAGLWAGVGWRAASHFAFPLGLLYFAIPFWDFFKGPLQALSAFMVSLLTSAAGLPAHIDGPYIVLPDATIFITLDCSGAHFLSVALALGALAIKFRGDGLRTGALIMVVAALLSMIFNWLRIFLIVLAYLDADLTHAMETMGHLTFGWWVFAVDIIAFWLVLRLIPSSARPGKEPESASAEPATGAGLIGPALTALTIALLPVSSWAAQLGRDYPVGSASPLVLPGLTGPLAPDPRWQPRFDSPAWEHRAAYLQPNGRVIEIYRNEYHRQSQGHELISNGSPLFDPALFSTQASRVVLLEGSDAPPLNVTRVDLKDKSGREWTAMYTYLIDDNVVATASRAQLVTALHSLYGRPVAGVLAALAPCLPDCQAASKTVSAAMIVADKAYRRQRE